MKASIYFLSVVISTFIGSMFLMGTTETIEVESKNITTNSNWEEDYSNRKKMIASINSNNKISDQNIKFVKQHLTQTQ